MIIHLFNSSSISGPERLVLPALASSREHFVIINLREERLERIREADPLEHYAKSLRLDYADVRVCSLWDEVAIADLRALLDRVNPDLVHAHDAKASAYLLYARQGSSSKYPIVSTHHGIHGRPDLKTRMYELFYRRYLLKFFDRCFCVSTADYETMRHSGLDGSRLRLHLNGIDIPWVDPQHRGTPRHEIRARWFPGEALPESLFLFGGVGRLSREKDQARLLKVLAQLNQRPHLPDWQCLLFGTGPLEKELRLLSTRLGLNSRIRWMGYRENVGAELAGLDMLLSFSKAEGLPISLLEAGWTSTPVLCTRVGGITDILPDDSYGMTIPIDEVAAKTADRLAHCLSPQGRLTLETQSRNFQRRVASEFTQSRWMQRLNDLYAELGVNFGTPLTRLVPAANGSENGNGSFRKRLHTAVFTRLLMYQSGRLKQVRHWNRNAFRILMYHRFPGTPEAQEALAKQCAHMVRHYRVVSMTDIARSLRGGEPLPPNAVALTVDDGYRDFFFYGHPVFHSFNLPVTVFLTSGFLDGVCWLWWDWLRYILERTEKPSYRFQVNPESAPIIFLLKTPSQRHEAVVHLTELLKTVPQARRLDILTDLQDELDVHPPANPPSDVAPLEWNEVRHLADQGVDFGAHTRTHPILSRIESSQELWDEIALCKDRIEEQCGRPVLHFAYPNGLRQDVNGQAVKVVEACRFQTAVSAERGMNYDGSHPYWLRRMGVEPITSKFNLEVLIAGLGGSRSSRIPFSEESASEIPTEMEVPQETPPVVHSG
jgi:glycosyltransferase involved in cell wall biosynthesis/peptidoglycan/xylan/chitin deacetylase (PgdA/CDA1 family)